MHELKIDRQVFGKAVNQLSSIINKKSPMSSITNIFFSINNSLLTLEASNLEISLQYNISCENQSSFSFLLKGQILNEVLKKTSGKILNLEVSEKACLIKDEKGNFSLPISQEKFPSTDNLQWSFLAEISGELLFSHLSVTNLPIDALEGGSAKISFNRSKIVFSKQDQRRIAFSSLDFDCEEGDINLSPRAWQEIRKVSEKAKKVRIYLSEKHFSLETEEVKLVSRLASARYGESNSLLQERHRYEIFSCSHKELKEAVDRVLSLSSQITRRVTFNFKENLLEVQSIDPNLGAAATSLEGEGKFTGSLNVNGEYFLQSLNLISEPKVQIRYLERFKPIFLETSDAVYLLMPIRI